MKTIIMKKISLYKKSKLNFGKEQFPFDIYTCRVSDTATNSFFPCLYYGPDVLNIRSDERKIMIHDKKKNLLEKLNLLKFFEMDNGYLSLTKLDNFLKVFHSHLPNYLTKETFPEEYNIKKEYLESLVEILHGKLMYDILEESYVQECVLKFHAQDDLNGEQVQEILTTVYVDILSSNYEKELRSCITEGSIPNLENEKINRYLKKLKLTLRSFFLFLTEECFRDVIRIVENEEFMSTEELFFLFQENYNLIFIDEEYNLYGDIDYKEFFDNTKPCKIILCTSSGEYKPVFLEYNFKNGYTYFNKSVHVPFSEIESIYKEKIDVELSLDDDESAAQKDVIEKSETSFRKVKEFKNHIDAFQNDLETTDISSTKECVKVGHYSLPIEHDFVQFLLNK